MSASATVAVSGMPPPPPAPTVSLAANPSSVASGGSSTLTWSSTNATSCSASSNPVSSAWSGSKALSDNTGQSTGALTTTSTFSLACTGTGGSASGSATVAVSGTTTLYSTNFNLTENPISEGGKWIDGKVVGLDWNDPRTVPGEAFASTLSGLGASRYDDSIAHLSTSFATFTPNQFSQGTVFKAAGYSPSGGHEVELLLRFQTTAHNARGYEVLWGIQGYIAIVRWNGALGDYTPLYDPGLGSISVPADGDVLRAEITGNTITVYKNGSLVASVSDSTYATGQPGMGFWPVDSSTPQNLGWKSYQAGNL